ncbi:MAG: nucleotidyl transferase AbiEii/AbiGii toxin family protein [Caldilineaceae bacterium]|nr:nucleotidyl transferase AbiEii/AbiGii toxin family protein [Caldilineaceae bacterium]
MNKKVTLLEQHCRLATEDELTLYQERLYPLQDRVFETASIFGQSLYLTGGTALARFHFQHRFSEDLDFFTQDAQLAPLANELIAQLQGRGLTVEVERVAAWFVRFFVVDQDLRLKINMVRDSLLTGELIQLPLGIYTNSVSDIGANKITAFEDRAEIKDIVDLYYICQAVPLPLLFELADRKRVPVAYEHLLTINHQGISGRALLTQPVESEALERFLQELRAATEAEVKKKEGAARLACDQIIADLLWDFPPDERTLSEHSIPVLQRRLPQLPLPKRRVVEMTLERNSTGVFKMG